MITKTDYLFYTQCPKSFWLEKFQPHLAAPPDTTEQRRLQAGQAVDKQARGQFPDGVHIPYRPRPEDMASLTAQAIVDGAEALFQATFVADDLLVKVDILEKTATSTKLSTSVGWHLIEVKSSKKYKPKEHLPDIAFQMAVL